MIFDFSKNRTINQVEVPAKINGRSVTLVLVKPDAAQVDRISQRAIRLKLRHEQPKSAADLITSYEDEYKKDMQLSTMILSDWKMTEADALFFQPDPNKSKNGVLFEYEVEGFDEECSGESLKVNLTLCSAATAEYNQYEVELNAKALKNNDIKDMMPGADAHRQTQIKKLEYLIKGWDVEDNGQPLKINTTNVTNFYDYLTEISGRIFRDCDNEAYYCLATNYSGEQLKSLSETAFEFNEANKRLLLSRSPALREEIIRLANIPQTFRQAGCATEPKLATEELADMGKPALTTSVGTTDTAAIHSET